MLSITLVYRGQTVGRIKMKLGMQVGLVPGHIVLDGDLVPLPNKGADHPNFRPMSIVAKQSPISATVEQLFEFILSYNICVLS